MNRTEAKELLPVITAFAEGDDVQWKYYSDDDQCWVSTDEPTFSRSYKWRIAPKPKTCERWCFAVFYADGKTSVVGFTSLKTAQAALAYQRHKPPHTFSPIVRVEFVEEKT